MQVFFLLFVSFYVFFYSVLYDPIKKQFYAIPNNKQLYSNSDYDSDYSLDYGSMVTDYDSDYNSDWPRESTGISRDISSGEKNCLTRI